MLLIFYKLIQYNSICNNYCKLYIKKGLKCGSYRIRWNFEGRIFIFYFPLNFLSASRRNAKSCLLEKIVTNLNLNFKKRFSLARNKGWKEGIGEERFTRMEAKPEDGRGQCTHRHVLAPVSGEGLFILEEDAVTRLPARLARCLANAALGLWKRGEQKNKRIKRAHCGVI